MEVTVLKLADLKRPEINIRRHPASQINEYVRSIKMFGQIRPIVVDEENRIIAGNGLYEALTMAGAEDVDCYVVKGLSEAQKKKLMLADNKIYDMGVFDIDSFEQIISELEGDLDVPGYDTELLEALTASAKETTEAINNYGTVSEQTMNQMRNAAERNAENGQAANTGEYAYGAGITPNTHEYGIPVQAAAGQAGAADGSPVPHPEGGRYVICPKCGEKIWL